MLTQEFSRILKGTLFVKNETHIISITSNSYKARNMEQLLKIISKNIEEKEKGKIVDELENLKTVLTTTEDSSLIFPDLSFELEFGYFNAKKSKILHLKNFTKENQKLSKKFFFNNFFLRNSLHFLF